MVFLVAGAALPSGLLLNEAPTGQYAGLAYAIILGASLIALILGVLLSGVLRYTAFSSMASTPFLCLIAALAAGFVLHRQFVPDACLTSPLKVKIAGEVLLLPPELRPRLENGDSIMMFGRLDKKVDFASLCRSSSDGKLPIAMDTVWITPASNYRNMNSACGAQDPPEWCSNYSADPYQRIGKILIAPKYRSSFPSPYWNEGGSIAKDRKGDLTNGSVCLLPAENRRTQCWTWQTFGDGSRITVSTNNLDPLFEDMPIETAREMIRQAGETTLIIMGQQL